MLSNKEKERIKEEEIFRVEVQKGLAVPQNKLIKFLNSSLGIWLLSTLVLGFYGWAYSRYQTSQQNEEIVRKLDIEIEARLGSGALQLEKMVGSGKAAPKDFVGHLLGPPTTDRAIQNEFSNRNLRSLLYDLNERVYKVERYFIRRSIDSVKMLEIDYLDKDLTPEDTIKLRNAVYDMFIPRWGADGMAHHRDVTINWSAIWFLAGTVVFVVGAIAIGIRQAKKKRSKRLNETPS